jgi:hypothetical protein
MLARGMRLRIAQAALATTLAFAGHGVPAFGQAPPARAPGERTHDGFYLQVALGPTVIRDSFESGDGNALFADTSGTVTGFGHAQHLAIGGALAPGFILAGAAAVDIARTTSTDYEGARVNPEQSYALLTFGPMVDYYFDEHGGWHALLGGGFGVTSGVQPDGVEGGAGSGYGFFAGVGHEWWVSEQWGIGALLRAQYVRAEESVTLIFIDTYKVQHSALGVALMFSATYN